MWKSFLKHRKQAMNYLKQHPEYNAIIHVIGGIGIGILMTNPLANPHPLRWGLIFVVVSLMGHLYTLTTKK